MAAHGNVVVPERTYAAYPAYAAYPYPYYGYPYAPYYGVGWPYYGGYWGPYVGVGIGLGYGWYGGHWHGGYGGYRGGWGGYHGAGVAAITRLGRRLSWRLGWRRRRWWLPRRRRSPLSATALYGNRRAVDELERPTPSTRWNETGTPPNSRAGFGGPSEKTRSPSASIAASEASASSVSKHMW